MKTYGLFPYHPRTLHHRNKIGGKLGLADATAMAIGGMIGGGIFSVLGTTVDIAGNRAYLCFVVAGIIALLTARSYAKLSGRAGHSGGPFLYLRAQGFPWLGATISWILICGYILALAVYAHTFGHYAANIMSLEGAWPALLSAGVMVAFLLINLRGIASSALTEDVIVFVKIAILAIVALAGVYHFNGARLATEANASLASVFVGAASIFVAYEGFELLSYDYDDIKNPRKNLAIALYLAVVIVIAIYVMVTIGSQMVVPNSVIVAQKEVAFTSVGSALFGGVGKWLAALAALLATSSAINATLFSSARQIHDVAKAGELPESLSRDVHGLPTRAIVTMVVAGTFFACLPNVLTLLNFGSFVFLLVFSLVNYLALQTAKTITDRLVSLIAVAGCAFALITLLVHLIQYDHTSLTFIVVWLPLVLVGRLLFNIYKTHIKHPSNTIA